MGEARGHLCWTPWMRRFSRAILGDQVVALVIPGFVGADHASDAIAAARELLEKTGHGDGVPWIPVGAGVHTGVAYVGSVGEGDALDFTALGDPVNTAARLASCAGQGEILVSSRAAAASQLNTAGLEARTLSLRGRAESVDAWVTNLTETVGERSLVNA